MGNDCKVMEFLLIAQIVNRNVKPMIHCVLNCRQPLTTGNDCQQAANFLLWICITVGMEKTWKINVEKDGTPCSASITCMLCCV